MIDQLNGAQPAQPMTETAKRLNTVSKRLFVLFAIIYIGSWIVNTVYREVKPTK